MSGRLVSCVLESPLPHRLKTLATVLASFGNDDGTSIRPSVATIARRWGRSVRRTRAGLSELRRLDVLIISRTRGPHRPTEYRIDLDQLAALTPARPQWSRQRRLPLFPQDEVPSTAVEFSTVSTGLTGRFGHAKWTLPSADPITDPISTNHLRARETKARGK